MKNNKKLCNMSYKHSQFPCCLNMHKKMSWGVFMGIHISEQWRLISSLSVYITTFLGTFAKKTAKSD